MARTLKSDRWLFVVTALLVFVGVLMVFSASAVLATAKYQQTQLFLFKQVAFAALGFFLLAFLMRIDYRRYRNPAVIGTVVALVFVALVVVLFGPKINGSRRWFGVAGVGVQPSEFAKVAAILFTAWILDARMSRINDARYALLPIGALVGAFSLLILLQPDFGTAFALVLIVGVMVFAAGLGWRYLIGLALVAVPLVAALVLSAPYRMRRLMTFLNPWDDPLGAGFQPIQSLIAVGTGGVTGRGMMAGVQKLFYLPEPHTDFIYAVIAEELGLVGATLILAGFGVIAWRGLRASLDAPDRFGAFVAIGLTTMIAMQALVNISVVLSLLPTKGIPLPFVSAGGSSLLVSLIGMGILLNVSQHASARS
ncbi:MAG: putative lipid II flippase FtsW [Acidobacteria bacterium]|nr:putative lipid II flippase FtsW [Acidobacteriota bacterium]